MYTQEMLIGIGIACVLGGIILGLIAGRFLLRSKHATTLEAQLSEAQAAMKNYKNEVFQQFGETARKFEKLNESYADLHQQLATSASVLCADMPDVPLLASSTVPALHANDNDNDKTGNSTSEESPVQPEVVIETETEKKADAETATQAADVQDPIDEKVDEKVVETVVEVGPQVDAAETTAKAASSKPASP